MDLVLGIDSGGTKTAVAFARRDGSVLAFDTHPSLDPTADAAWPATLETVLASQGDRIDRLAAAAFGLPFHGEVAAYSARQSEVCSNLLSVPVIVDNDVRIAFDGAFAGKGGALILAGTGSMAWASRNGADDPHVRVGGWGDAFGDEGSAFWIGRESLALVSREVDGRADKSGFSDAILAALGIAPDELIAWCYGLDNRRAAFAGLSATTARLAEDGHDAARAILERAGDALAETLLAAWRQVAGAETARWSHAGGVMASAIVVERIAERVGSTPIERRLPPIGGALYRAAVHAGWPADERWLDALAASLAGTETPSDQEKRSS